MILDKMSLSGKIAVVTGASRGLGRAMSLGLAEAGADLALVSRNTSLLEAVAGELEHSTKEPDVIDHLRAQGGASVLFDKIFGSVRRCNIYSSGSILPL